jgi:hypothetical protein
MDERNREDMYCTHTARIMVDSCSPFPGSQVTQE